MNCCLGGDYILPPFSEQRITGEMSHISWNSTGLPQVLIIELT